MKLYRLSVFVIILSLVLGLTACTRSVPTPQKEKATKTPAQQAKPTGATEVFDAIQSFATQTALAALQGLPTQAPVVQPTLAPVVQPTQVQQIPQPTPTVAAIVPPPPTPGIPATYTLVKGEFPFCIARRFNVDPAELLSINGLGSRSLYYAGMVLRIPQNGHPFPGNRVLRSHPTTYTASSGETIHSIACLFGNLDPGAIAFANNLTPPYTLTQGQALNIP